MPKVSVLTPVYRTNEDHLRTAIESILNQTFEDFEFILLDDCPDDTRRSIIESYDDPRIIYAVNETNMGISPARNKLMSMASGEYIAIFDHDDISLPRRLELQAAFLDSHPDYGVVGCQGLRIPANTPMNFPVEHDDIKYAMMTWCAAPHTAAMVRRSVLVENHIHYEAVFSPAEDYALWSRLLCFTRFHNLPEQLYHYRDHETCTTYTQSQRMTASSHAVYALNRHLHPEYYDVMVARGEHLKDNVERTYVKLFNFLPFLFIKKKGSYVHVYLFFVIPLFKFKTMKKSALGGNWL